jgi:hypothetical protein
MIEMAQNLPATHGEQRDSYWKKRQAQSRAEET